MPARILDGKALARTLTEGVKKDVDHLSKQGIVPGLAVIMVGDNPASKVYVNRKQVSCKEAGIHSEQISFPENAGQEEIIAKINELNANKKIHGILVQLPLPDHMDEKTVLQSVSPNKDVDGFHVINCGELYYGNKTLVPNTPRGVLHLIKETGQSIAGKNAVVVGRSKIVGKPTALLLLQEDATVTLCHSKTTNLSSITQQADILVVATGVSRLIKKDMVKEGAIVIDVGISKTEKGLHGDVDFENVKEKAGWITPVPGGVGPMTVACLLENTLNACKQQEGMPI
jgi:methylenetetrahydrofolate dehydrogenase (NADP+) / methenyltetrahydrofolate cyclohydrolase